MNAAVGVVGVPVTRPLGARFLGTPRLLATTAIITIAVATYVLAPILDDRIPEVFRHADWLTYSRAATRLLDGQPLYVPAQLAGPYVMADIATVGYVYPPPSVLLFMPFLALGPAAWASANAFFFASGIAAMARRDFGRDAGLAFGIALLVIAIAQPYRDAMVMGNINLGIAGLFAWAWALGRGSRPVGLLAGVGGILKVHPFALASWTRPSGARRTIGGAIPVALGIVLVTLPVVGIGSWIDYLRAATNTRPLCGAGFDAVACPLIPMLGPLATPVLVGISGVLLASAILTRSDIVSFALVIVAILIPHPEMFVHTLLLPEVLVVAIAGSAARRRLDVGAVAPLRGAVP